MEKKNSVLIRSGLIYDGSGSEPFVSDICIVEDKITSVGSTSVGFSDSVIDARGLAVSPGFIDTHAHSDFILLADPRAEGKILQGITTEINGNCGMSAAPLYNRAFDKREDDLKEFGISERWNSLSEYFVCLERRPITVNVAMLAGHGNLRGSIVGYDNRIPTDSEMNEMSNLLLRTLGEGAIGLSSGLIYPPGLYASTDELVILSRSLKPKSLIYATHLRSEGEFLIEAIHEVLKIGREAGIKVHVSHIKTSGEPNWHKADRVISLLNEAIGSGIRITCDRYPYTASSTDLDSLLPSWAFEGGNADELKRLQNPEILKKINKEIEEKIGSTEFWQKVIVSSVSSEKNGWMEGKSIAEISLRNSSCEIATMISLLVEEKLRVGALFHTMSEDNLRKFLSLPYCMIGSDSSARSFDGPTKTGKPHPRAFGTIPRFLGKYVREEKIMGLPEAISRATSVPALTFDLKGRGQIKEGYFADIVIFDPEKISDAATFGDPFRKPEGIYYVIVNGVPEVAEECLTGMASGRILKS